MEEILDRTGVANGETLYIDGKWMTSRRGRVFDVTDPATGNVIGHAADAGATETRQAVGVAVTAFRDWSQRTAYERSEALYRAHALMTDRAEDLARLMTREQGKPLRAARNEV